MSVYYYCYYNCYCSAARRYCYWPAFYVSRNQVVCESTQKCKRARPRGLTHNSKSSILRNEHVGMVFFFFYYPSPDSPRIRAIAISSRILFFFCFYRSLLDNACIFFFLISNLFFPSVNHVFTESPVPVSECSAFSENIPRLYVDPLKRSFFFVLWTIVINWKKPENSRCEMFRYFRLTP